MEGGIPNVKLNSGRFMPTIGLGTASDLPVSAESFRTAILEAISLGYRHFDTASLYGTETKLGEAVADAIQQGLIKSREELFITSKIWATDAHHDRVVPALQLSLRGSNMLEIYLAVDCCFIDDGSRVHSGYRSGEGSYLATRSLQLEYLDLYLIHSPVSLKPKEAKFPIDRDDIIPMDMKSVWEAMEKCQKMGLVKSIGVSNFSCKKLEHLLSSSRIVPSVNQVEMHPVWQQKKLMDFCKEKGIHVVAYSPLGAYGTVRGTNLVMECEVLKEIALTRGKSIAQISLRWIHAQGASLVVKSFRKERMKENIEIFDWELSDEELHKISLIPQSKIVLAEFFVSATGPYKSLDELWDGEI